jgi:hypothetical protein
MTDDHSPTMKAYYQGAMGAAVAALCTPVIGASHACNLVLQYARQGGALGTDIIAMKAEIKRMEMALETLREAHAHAVLLAKLDNKELV